MLAYIVAALIWWFIELNRQNNKMTELQKQRYELTQQPSQTDISEQNERKVAQYVGEGATFLLLIIIGAVIIFRSIRRQLRLTQQQQHFMMAITHEIKTPIAVSMLNLETIKKRSLEEEQKEKLMNNTLEELNRLNTLSNNLLVSSQMEAGGYRMVRGTLDLNTLVEECISGFRKRYIQHQVEVSSNGPANIQGDPVLLQMLINNILDNAAKYSPKQSLIKIELKSDKESSRLNIADRGNGIPDEEKEKVFTKFYRRGNEATRGAKGTGLGLYLVKRITDVHGGRVTVADNDPTGSVFILTLPSGK